MLACDFAQERHQRAGLKHSGLDRISHVYPFLPQGIEQTGGADKRSLIQSKRINQCSRDAVPDDADGFRPYDRTDYEIAVLNDQLFALDQRQTQVTHKIVVFGIVLIARSGDSNAICPSDLPHR